MPPPFFFKENYLRVAAAKLSAAVDAFTAAVASATSSGVVDAAAGVAGVAAVGVHMLGSILLSGETPCSTPANAPAMASSKLDGLCRTVSILEPFSEEECLARI